MDIKENTSTDCSYFSIMDYHTGTELNLTGTPAISLYTTLARQDHNTEVLSCEFHPSGQFLLSSSRDGAIQVCDNDSDNMVLMKGHNGPVKETHFSMDGSHLYSCSADGTVGIWDTFRGVRTSTLRGHTSDVNSIRGGRMVYPVMCSGSVDGSVRIWDAREHECAMSMDIGAEVNAVCFNDNGDYVFSTGVNKDIQVLDLRMSEVIDRLQGHADTVTGLSLSPCGSYLLSNSIDNTLRIWDVRPHASADRFVGCFPTRQSIKDGLLRCAWSPDGRMISAGTSDGIVCVWDPISGVKLFELPAQESCINDIAFHPNEFVMLTASNDCLCLCELSK